MYKNPYSDTAPYELKHRAEEIKKKIKAEYKEGQPDEKKIQRLMEELYMPNLFSGFQGSYERFRAPW